MKTVSLLCLLVSVPAGVAITRAAWPRGAAQAPVRRMLDDMKQEWEYPGAKMQAQTGGAGGSAPRPTRMQVVNAYVTPDPPEIVWKHYWRQFRFKAPEEPWGQAWISSNDYHVSMQTHRPGLGVGQLFVKRGSAVISVTISHAAHERDTHIFVVVEDEKVLPREALAP